MDTTPLRERWPSTTPTSRAICRRESLIESHDTPGLAPGSIPAGAEPVEGKVDLQDTIVIETTDGERLEFEVVGLVEDDEEHETYAVAYSEGADEFVVTDEYGKLLADDDLAQEILDDFTVLAEESQPSEN